MGDHLWVLAADPCSLLDPIRPAQIERFKELARDSDGQGGRMTDSSKCEARLALTLESRQILEATVVRPAVGDVEDGVGQVWDFKSPHSREAIVDRITRRAAIAGGSAPEIPPSSFRGEFNLATEILRANGQQQRGKGVVFDLRRLTVDDARRLITAIAAEPRINPDLLLYFPAVSDIASFEGG